MRPLRVPHRSLSFSSTVTVPIPGPGLSGTWSLPKQREDRSCAPGDSVLPQRHRLLPWQRGQEHPPTLTSHQRRAWASGLATCPGRAAEGHHSVVSLVSPEGAWGSSTSWLLAFLHFSGMLPEFEFRLEKGTANTYPQCCCKTQGKSWETHPIWGLAYWQHLANSSTCYCGFNHTFNACIFIHLTRLKRS